MKLKSVHFINPVSFSGTITSANAAAPADPMRAGSTPYSIDLIEYSGFPTVRLQKKVNEVLVSTYVPLTNVANFMEMPSEEKKVEGKAK